MLDILILELEHPIKFLMDMKYFIAKFALTFVYIVYV